MSPTPKPDGASVEPWDGVPLNQERDGWHWLRTDEGEDIVAQWAGDAWIQVGLPGSDAPADIGRQWTYLGAALTPSEATELVTTHAHRVAELLEARDRAEAEVVRLRGIAGPALVSLQELVERAELLNRRGGAGVDVRHAKAVLAHAALAAPSPDAWKGAPDEAPGLERAATHLIKRAADWRSSNMENGFLTAQGRHVSQALTQCAYELVEQINALARPPAVDGGEVGK